MCKSRCNPHYLKWWKKNRQGKPPGPRDCTHCGEEFRPSPFHPNQRFCSELCNKRHLKGQEGPHWVPEVARCDNCGDPYERIRYNQRFCSVQCKDGRSVKPSWRKCLECGEPFYPVRGHPDQMYCRKRCGYLYRRRLREGAAS